MTDPLTAATLASAATAISIEAGKAALANSLGEAAQNTLQALKAFITPRLGKKSPKAQEALAADPDNEDLQRNLKTTVAYELDDLAISERKELQALIEALTAALPQGRSQEQNVKIKQGKKSTSTVIHTIQGDFNIGR